MEQDICERSAARPSMARRPCTIKHPDSFVNPHNLPAPSGATRAELPARRPSLISSPRQLLHLIIHQRQRVLPDVEETFSGVPPAWAIDGWRGIDGEAVVAGDQ